MAIDTWEGEGGLFHDDDPEEFTPERARTYLAAIDEYHYVPEINRLVKECYENSKAHGFWEGEQDNNAVKIALLHSELSEALEADRKNHHTDKSSYEMVDSHNHDYIFDKSFEVHIKNTFEDELADVAIRLFDLAGRHGINLDKHIKLKMRYNSTRPHKHGKAY